MTTTHPLAPTATIVPVPARPDRSLDWTAFWRRFGYEITGLPLAVASFALVLAALVTGISLAITVVGLPILAFALFLSSGFAALERRRVRWLDGSVPPSHHRSVSGGVLRKSWQMMLDPQRWRDLVHALVIFPIRITTFVVSVTIVAVALGGTTYVLWRWALPDDNNGNDLPELLGLGSSAAADILLQTGIGLVALVTAPYVVHGCAALDAGLAKLLLCDENAGLRAEVDRLAATRAAAVEAEAHTLRRVERDIHDGPQQRLVRLTMDLQSAQRRMADDPAAASTLVGEALQHAQDALGELRAVSRGIAPPILADRGLFAALAAAAARSPVPVDLDVDLGPAERPSPAVENAVYFVVVEALTNVAKHAQARMAGVTVRLVPSTEVTGAVIDVQVVDDGVGGAHLGKGHGLAGLADRVATLDGQLAVESPAGGPTAVRASIPVGAVRA